jgi:hypothetical protein
LSSRLALCFPSASVKSRFDFAISSKAFVVSSLVISNVGDSIFNFENSGIVISGYNSTSISKENFSSSLA